MPDDVFAEAEAFIHEQLVRLGRGLKAALESRELPRSQALVPFEYGFLSSTGQVTEPVIEGHTVSCSVGYGDVDVERTWVSAIMQHERLDYNHPRGGQAKYLEQAIIEGQPTLMSRIQRYAK